MAIRLCSGRGSMGAYGKVVMGEQFGLGAIRSLPVAVPWARCGGGWGGHGGVGEMSAVFRPRL